MSSEIKKPIFDGYEGLKELIDWVSEPLDIQERSSRLKEVCLKSVWFGRLLWLSFKEPMSFKEVVDQGIKFKFVGMDRYVCQPVSKTVAEIDRYSDQSNVPKNNRYNQLCSVLDWTWFEDADLLLTFINGGNIFGDKINLELLKLTFPEEMGN